jgi:hypothetical protein
MLLSEGREGKRYSVKTRPGSGKAVRLIREKRPKAGKMGTAATPPDVGMVPLILRLDFSLTDFQSLSAFRRGAF